ncbi:MAG: DNA polymerase III subunit delta [Alphaproteobacteria bacterium]
MKLQFRDIDPFLKKPDPKALAVLVYGPDEGLVRERASGLAKLAVSDASDPFAVAEFSGSHLSDNPSLLLDEAQSISMLGGRRVVRVRDATDKIEAIVKSTLAALKPGCNMVILEAADLWPASKLRKLFEDAPNAVALPCYVDDARDLTKILSEELRSRGYTISSDALQYMAANVVGDRGVARGEAEKLSIYMGGYKDIALEDVMASVGGSAQLPLEDLARTAASGNVAEADRILTHLLHEGESPVRILRVMLDHFTRLHVTKARMAGDGLELALKKLRPPLFFKHKDAFLAQLNGWSFQQLEQALNIISSAEAKCKQTGSTPDVLLGRAVLSLAQLGGKAVAGKRRA